MTKKKPLPRKRTTGTASGRTYSRAAMCREFSIVDRTLRHLERYGRIAFKWKTQHGMLRSTLNRTQRDVLACAACDAHSLAAKNELFVPPYFRFAYLRYFQVSEDELFGELVERSMCPDLPDARHQVARLYRALDRSLPSGVISMCKAKREPKTKREAHLFETLLYVGGVHQVYHNPESEQGFDMLADPDIKAVIEAAMCTVSSVEEIREFLSEATGVEFNRAAVIFYQWVFGDFSRMRVNDVAAYTASLSGFHKTMITRAMNGTVDSLRVELGMHRDADVEDTYEVARQEATRRLMTTVSGDSASSAKEFRDSLRSFMFFVDREDRRKTQGADDMPAIFRAMELVPAETDTSIFHLPEAVPVEDVGGTA